MFALAFDPNSNYTYKNITAEETEPVEVEELDDTLDIEYLDDINGLVGIIKEAWYIYTAEFGALLLVVMLAYMPYVILRALVYYFVQDWMMLFMRWFHLSGNVSFPWVNPTLSLISSLFMFLALGIIVRIVEVYVVDEEYSLKEIVPILLKNTYPKIAGLWVLLVIIMTLYAGIFARLTILIEPMVFARYPILGNFIPLIFVIPAVIPLVYWVFAFITSGLRGAAGVTAFRYSFEIVKGNWWRVFGFLVVVIILESGWSYLINSFGSALAYDQFMIISSDGMRGVNFLDIALPWLQTVVFYPFQVIALTLMYLKLEHEYEAEHGPDVGSWRVFDTND